MTEAPWLANYDEGVPASLEPYPDLTLLDYLRESATTWPNRPFLFFQGATVDYARLEADSDAMAAALASMGVKAGDRVGICLPNCPQFLVAEFAAWKLGAIVCPFNPTYTERETEDALRTTGAETVVVLNRFYDKIKAVQPATSVKRVIATGIKDYLPLHLRVGYTVLKERKDGERIKLKDGDSRLTSLIRRNRRTRPATARIDPSTPAVILMSGGTTGTPKGVVGSHRSMVIAGHQLRTWLRPAMNEWTDSIMMPLPLFHTYGNTGLQSLALINHNPVSLIPNPRDIPALLKEIKQIRPAFICTVPTLLHGIMNHSMARSGQIDFHSIKLCFSGAAALMAETRKRFEDLTGGVIVEGYSLTEAQMAVVANPVRGPKKTGSIGMPLPDVRVRIVAEDGHTSMPLGEVGEIVISAPQLMQGYWNQPAETAEIIRHEQGQRQLFTGDLGYIDEDGYIFIVDRKKDLIKTCGFQVWPREIEEVLSAHPAVGEVGVIGLPDKMRGEVVKAFVVLRVDQKASAAELKTYCREHLVYYKVPAKYEFVTELPKTQIGKVLRRVLRQRNDKTEEVEPVAETTASP